MTGSTSAVQSASSPGYQCGRLCRNGQILNDSGCARTPEYRVFVGTSGAAAESSGRRATLSARRIATKEATAARLAIVQGAPCSSLVRNRYGSTEADGQQLESIPAPAL